MYIQEKLHVHPVMTPSRPLPAAHVAGAPDREGMATGRATHYF